MEKTGTGAGRARRGLLPTLRSRLIALVLLASLPALGLIVYTNVEQRIHDSAEARAEALSSIRQIATRNTDVVQDTRTLLSVLSRLASTGDAQALSVLLGELLGQQDAYSNLGFIGADGLIRASALPFRPPVYLGDRAYFRRAVENRDFSIGDYQIGAITKAATINFGYPAFEGGELKGVFFAALPITLLGSNLSDQPLHTGQTLIIADGAGTVLAGRPMEENWPGKSLKGTALAPLLASGQTEGHARLTGPDEAPRV